MTDYQELKRLAEAANAGYPLAPLAYEPHGDTGTYGVGVLQNERGLCVLGRQELGEMLVVEPVATDVSGEKYAAFIASCSPGVVLGLISALESKSEFLDDFIHSHKSLVSQRDQLKADLDEARNGMKFQAALRLKKEIERLEAEVEGLRKIISESATACGAAVSVECSLEFMQHLPAEIASVVDGLRERHDIATRRNGMLEQNVEAMTQCHVRYTWLRKKVDRPYNEFVAVTQNIGHHWIVVHDLDRALDQMIEEEQP